MTPSRTERSAAERPIAFDYVTAFSRNIGWLTEWEQQALKGSCVAIAGMGGVGGVHLLTLARFGIGGFRIADLDRFELANFNRQVGATVDTIDRPKVEVLAELALQINPDLRLTRFADGVRDDNIDAFLDRADVFIDGFDFFALDIRRRVHARCRALGIPAIIAAPLGMGAALLVFRPDGMSFDDWFRLDGLAPEQQSVSFLLGLAPSALHRFYLADPGRVDLRRQRGPSTSASCELCAGVAAVETVKLLIGRGRVRAVPYYHQFDPFVGKWAVRRLPHGNGHPLQRLKLALARRTAAKLSDNAVPPVDRTQPLSEIEAVLEEARWAPSGDNTQPWRFQLTGDRSAVLYLTNQSAHDVYDYRDGEPSLLAGGMLLESIAIAASARGRQLEWDYQGEAGSRHRIGLRLQPGGPLPPDPLYRHLPMRSVDRRGYRLTPLSSEQKAALAAALGPGLALEWHETPSARWRIARLNALATEIRLRIPEAFPVHQRIVDRARDFSPAGIPMRALGLDPVARRLMRWALSDWRRMHAMNRLGATALARLEMDLIPGLCCAAHFTVLHKRPSAAPASAEFLLQCGQRLQRFWLKATQLGLVLQPSLAPLCFAHYGREGAAFTAGSRALDQARRLAAALDRLAGGAGERMIFLGRIGTPRSTRIHARSVRRAADDLVLEAATPARAGAARA